MIPFCFIIWLAFFSIPVFFLMRWRARQKFRLHLSTMLMATILAGGIMYLNVRSTSHGILWGRFEPLHYWRDFGKSDVPPSDLPDRYIGWPIICIKPEFWHLYNGPDDPSEDLYMDMLFNLTSAVCIILLFINLTERAITARDLRSSAKK